MSKVKKTEMLNDYPVLRKQLEDFYSTFYGPHSCDGCGTLIVKKAFEQGAQSWEKVSETAKFIPHHCTHIALFKHLAGKVLTILDASLLNNPKQHKAVVDLLRQEFSRAIGRARELEGDRGIETPEDSGLPII